MIEEFADLTVPIEDQASSTLKVIDTGLRQ